MITLKTVMDEGYVNEFHYKLYLVTTLDEILVPITDKTYYELHYGSHVKNMGDKYPSTATLVNTVML